MIRTGDVFKNIKSGIIFTVKSVDPHTILLETKGGSHSMFVDPKGIESEFVPVIEDEAKEKLKEYTKAEIRYLIIKSRRKGNLCYILTPYARIARKNSN